MVSKGEKQVRKQKASLFTPAPSFQFFSLLVVFLFFLTLANPAFAQEFNSKSVQSITLRVVQSGQLVVTGDVDRMNLTLYIPQEGVQKLDASGTSQQQLFDQPDRERQRELDRVTDQIKTKFGNQAIRRSTKIDKSQP